jgi:hypothetical protein
MTHERMFQLLVNNGFLKREARKIAYAKVNQASSALQDPDVLWKSGLVQKAIRSRRSWIKGCLAEGWSINQIRNAIPKFYQRQEKDSDFFKWLRIEYAIPASGISTYSLSLKLRERAQINRVARYTGVRYGKKLPTTLRPKPELFVRQPEDNFLGKP